MAARENLRIGDCEIYADAGDGNGEQFLGQTKDGVEVSYEPSHEDLTVDKYGSSPLDMALTGEDVRFKFNLAEVLNENLSYAIPFGSFAEAGSDSKIGAGGVSGQLASSKAKAYRFHPRKNTPSNRNEDIYVHIGLGVGNVDLAYKVDEQRVIPVEVRALIDETQPAGQRLFRIGDADIS